MAIPLSPIILCPLPKADQLQVIEKAFADIMNALGLDLTDDSLQNTPKRVAKMYVEEIFTGLDPYTFPKITVQDNKFGYNQMLIESNISIHSVCEHHFVPIIGMAHIAYIPGQKVIGLSKLNRIAHHYARRPQVQERLTEQIKACLTEVLDTIDVAVTVDAIHYCVKMRGVKDSNCVTRTTALGGKFLDNIVRAEYLNAIPKM